MKLLEIAEEAERLAGEFGNVEAVIPDLLEPGWTYPIDRLEWEAGQEHVKFVSDR